MSDLQRVLRDQLRHDLFHALNQIEEVVGRALDHIAEEAVAYGVDETHDFAIDRLAAQAADRIGRELDLIITKALETLAVVESSPPVEFAADVVARRPGSRMKSERLDLLRSEQA